MFFTKKEKVNKEKKGCLKPLIIGIVVLVVVGVLAIFSLRNVFQLYGVSLKDLNAYISWISQDVNESELTTNPIKSADLTTFNQKATQSGLKIYDAGGNINFNLNQIKLDSTLTLNDYEVGAMINESAKAENKTQVYSLLELSITENSDGKFTLKTVVKFNLADIKAELGKYGEKIPSNIYITSIGQISKVGSRVQTADNEIFINQLDAQKNKKLVDLITSIQAESQEEIKSIKDINNYLVAEILTDIALKSNSTPQLGNHTFSFVKN